MSSALMTFKPVDDLVVDAVDGGGEVGVAWPCAAIAEDDLDLVEVVVGVFCHASTTARINVTLRTASIASHTFVTVGPPVSRTASGVW